MPDLAAISHAVDLAAFANWLAARALAALAAHDKALHAALIEVAEALPAGAPNMAKLDALLKKVREINAEAYADMLRELEANLRAFISYEADYRRRLLAAIAKAEVMEASPERIKAALRDEPFQGRLLREWAQTLGQATAQRLRDTVAIGFAEGKTTAEIVRAVRGTRAGKYQDGILQIDRRHAEAVVRTSVQHFANYAAQETYRQNRDVVKALRWVSTLDSRTSEICMLRDGLKFSLAGKGIGHDVAFLGGPPAHWNCRSTLVPVTAFDDDRGQRAAAGGPVPKKTTYADWIKAQPASVQRSVLGATRARLMREGKLDLTRFYDNRGRWLTLDELRESDEATFKRLGL